MPSEIKLEQCNFRDAASELRKVYGEYPGRRVVLKVDCEGSEYAVLRRLGETAMFNQIHLMMIECHRRAGNHDPSALRASLCDYGFACVHLQPDSSDISMLYAFYTRAAHE